jgi:hypothetical protein
MQEKFFWDLRGVTLRWPVDQELITARLLAIGDLAAIRWVRKQLGDDGLRSWLARTNARGLSARQIAFWGIVLGLPPTLTRSLTERSRTAGAIG